MQRIYEVCFFLEAVLKTQNENTQKPQHCYTATTSSKQFSELDRPTRNQMKESMEILKEFGKFFESEQRVVSQVRKILEFFSHLIKNEDMVQPVKTFCVILSS